MTRCHMSGAGNTFGVLDIRGQSPDLEALAVTWCAELGADGLLALDDSQIADFRLHFYNADGLRGEMCGNGARCICKFAYDLGIAGPAMTVETDGGIVKGWRLSENTYRVALNAPSVLEPERKPGCAYVELGDPGVPHCVLRIPGLEFSHREKLRPLAKQLRYDPAFPKGANVNFYDLCDGGARLLTYERGVEDYTLACGTGSASVALVLSQMGKLPEGRLTVKNPGGDLRINLEGGIFLEGPANYF